jgi:hypothetical protein
MTKQGGRPSKYSERLAATICGRISCGESLKAVCRDPAMPMASTVFLWLSKDEAFRDQYSLAMQSRSDAQAEEILEIADTPMIGEKVVDSDENGVTTTREDMLGHRRLQIDTRKWLMARMLPKKYGDKIEQNHIGAPLVTRIELVDGEWGERQPEEWSKKDWAKEQTDEGQD